MTLSFSENFQNPAGALLWQLESGVDMPLSDVLVKITVNPVQPPVYQGDLTHPSAPHNNAPHPNSLPPFTPPFKGGAGGGGERVSDRSIASYVSQSSVSSSPAIIATPEATQEAIRLASNAQTLDDLRAAIQNFDGIQMKRHASHMVFADGNPSARVMVVGDAPGTDDDQQGLPFCGEEGALLDKMFAAIGLSRASDDPATSIYITAILNWRPPGNRTPTDAEIDISLPFIERHIALIKPQMLVIAGGVAAKALLGVDTGITKLRGKFYDYQSRTISSDVAHTCRAMPIYHPSFLLRTPVKKREAWEDLQLIKSEWARLNGV